MVKIPKAAPTRVAFKDAKGRFVRQEERYQKATVVERLFRGKWIRVTEGTKVITPRRLANLLNREEFESLAPNYSTPTEVKPTARKYTAWDVAGKLEQKRGIRGHMVRITMNLLDAGRLRKVTFYHKIRRKGRHQYSLFRAMNHALANEKIYLYNRIGSKMLPDRRGKEVHLQSVEIAKEL